MVRFCENLIAPKSMKFNLDANKDPETGKSEVDVIEEFAMSRRCTVSKAIRDIVMKALYPDEEPEQNLYGNNNGIVYRAGGSEPSFADNPMIHEEFIKNACFPVNVLKGRAIAGKKIVKHYERQYFVQEDEDYMRGREESQYSKIVKLVKKAREEKAPIQRLADKYAIWFTPITLAMCGLGWFLTQNPQTILSVLVVATPCPLIFATPVAIIGGIDKAAKQSVIVKSGAAIEQISRADAVVFDKTGTMTYGMPLVEEIILLDNFKNNRDGKNLEYTKDDILFKAASLEQMSSHPSAQSITKAGKEKFSNLPLPTSFHEESGLGVEGYVNGEHIFVGSSSYIESQSNSNPNYGTINRNDKILKTVREFQKLGKMVVLVNINGTNAAIIRFSDKVRDGVVSMIQNLKKEGIKETIMLTGDSLDNAKSIANQTGVDNYRYNLLPEDKVNEVKKLREKFKDIIMIGDGINDAPALTTASVGIAMGAKGTAISAEAADVVLLVDDITRVSNVIHIGKNTIRIAKQSIFFGVGISFLLMIFASFGLIPPSIGALFQEALDIGVILNALRAK